MKPCENVIVTLTGGTEGPDYDMELPAFLNIGRLREKLEETLRVMDPRLLPPGQELQLQYEGRTLATAVSPGQASGTAADCSTQ